MSQLNCELSQQDGCHRCYWSDRCGCGIRCVYFDPIEVTTEEEDAHIDSVKKRDFKIYEEIWDEYISDYE